MQTTFPYSSHRRNYRDVIHPPAFPGAYVLFCFKSKALQNCKPQITFTATDLPIPERKQMTWICILSGQTVTTTLPIMQEYTVVGKYYNTYWWRTIPQRKLNT